MNIEGEQKRVPGRPTLQDEPMVKTHKRLSLPESLMSWLEEQSNQSETIRQSLELFKDNPSAVLSLPSVELDQKCRLPERPLVYLVLNVENKVLYVGQTQNGKARWSGGHHKLKALREMQGIRIAWIEVSELFLLKLIEDALIQCLEPLLNDAPGRPSEGKQKTSVSFDPDIWELIKDLGWKQRSPLVNQVLRENIERYL